MNFRLFIFLYAFMVACNGFSVSGRTQFQVQMIKSRFETFQLHNKRYQRIVRIEKIKAPNEMKLQLLQLLNL